MGIEQAQMHVTDLQTAQTDENVRAKLGDNITPGFAIPTPTRSDDGKTTTQIYAVPMSGSNGEGTLHVEYEMTVGQPVVRTVFNIEIDGEVIDLMNSDDFSVDLEEPGEAIEEEMEKPLEMEEPAEMEEPVGAGG